LIAKAFWLRNETLEFWLDNDGTGFSGVTVTPITVDAIRLFTEINTECSEYDPLSEDLMSSGMTNRLGTNLVEFP